MSTQLRVTLPLVVTVLLMQSVDAAPQKFGRVNVAGVSINGLNQTEATRRLKRELAPKLRASVRLNGGTVAVSRRRSDLGVELNLGAMLSRARKQKYVPLTLRVNQANMTRAMRQLAPRFRRAARDARPVLYRGKVQIRPEQNAQSLNLGASISRAATQIEKNAATRVLNLAVYRRAPKLTRARLKGINGVLASYTTRFNPSNVKRTQNMRIGIRSIDGTLLSPNEVFSLNKTVGERTQARGYRTTIIFKNGYKVSGIGGGISQVTGTIFNAALLSGLPILEYRTHSRPVTYIPIGRDATVAWGGFDMKFKNNTGAPVFISYKIGGSRATATLFGKKIPGQGVSTRVIARNIGPREKKAQLYRTIRRNGKVVKKEKVGNSHYKWNQADWEAD